MRLATVGKAARLLPLLGLAIMLTACQSQSQGSAPSETPPAAASPQADAQAAQPIPTGTGNLVQLAAGSSSLATMTAALDAAGLTETLAGEGPYTVFAPTDAAFEALPKTTLEELLKPTNKRLLARVLSYHIVSGYLSGDNLQSGTVQTLEGAPVNVQVDTASRSVKVNDARVIQPNVQASNGVIHAIDKVILPPDWPANLK